ncbi:hypothetical protein GTZ99_08770 [Novosphingobium sp. FSY-8]|uniref:DUF2946 family protein n=1 Tax=Novosphingobium ovatum TaxID=1908523 RepID=A0ABW9XDN8_9SPHN|nr:hypothetical protein [Novosphingobium ovatum]NBC36649.1 hypothetical protein [Novosphingobium ovatum]
MMRLRLWSRANWPLAALLLAVALCMKALVPSGYMVSAGRTLTITICADASGSAMTRQIAVASDAATHAHDSAKADMAKKPCAFTGHAAALMGGADGWLLAGALAFVLALGFAPVARPRLARATWVLPPASGPPLYA